MWKLTIHQAKTVTLPSMQIEGGDTKEIEPIEMESCVEYVDKNMNNLLDLIRYLNECGTPSRTWYSLEDLENKTLNDL